MGFSRKSTVSLQRTRRSAFAVWCLRLLSLILRAGIAVTAILALTALVVMVRLQQGPIALPGIAQLVVDRINADTPGARIEVSDAVFSLGEGDTPSGLRFLDVRVIAENGELLFEAPRIAASFLAQDVVRGRFQPIRISLLQPTLEVVRDPEGRFRVGLTTPVEAADEPQPVDAPSDDRFEMLADALDSLVGDTETYPELSRLREITVVGADLTYIDEGASNRWRTQDAGVRITKHDRGVRAVLTLDDIAGDEAGLSLRLLADRLIGTGETLLAAQFGRVAAKALADQAPGLDWLNLIDGEVEGRASAVLARDGSIRDLSGTLVAEDGDLDLNGDSFPYEFARLVFAVDPEGQSVEVRDFTASSRQFGVRMKAFADLSFDSVGEFSGLALDAEVDRLSLILPEVFDHALEFDAAGVTASWERSTNVIEIASADLRASDTTYNLIGRLSEDQENWLGDLRLSAVDTTIEKVLQIWPVAAAANARDWVNQNIQRANIPELLVNMRFGDGDPVLAMDFEFTQLDATYIAGMSPLQSVAGNARVGYHGLELEIDSGFVQPRNRRPIALGGSKVVISGFWDDVTNADIFVAGKGDVQSVLSLIDQNPLRLIQKLDADLGPVKGAAALDVTLNFPLESDLALDDVQVVADATLSDLDLNYDVPSIGKIRIEADTAKLRADTDRMSLSGAVFLDGMPSRVTWQENYGAGLSGRTLDLESIATAGLLARLDLGAPLIEGKFPFDLNLTQSASKPLRLLINANLTDAAMAIADLGWQKPAGVRGSLEVDLLPDGDIVFDRLRLDTPDLRIDGKVMLDRQGRFQSAELARLNLRKTFDVAANIQLAGANSYTASISGEYLDLPALLDRQGDGSGATTDGPAIDATVRLERLDASEDIRLLAVSGRHQRTSSGAVTANIEGSLAGQTPIVIALTRSAAKTGKITVTGEDAGEVLRAMELYDDAKGGKLTLNADLDAEADLDGIIRIENLQIGESTSFQRVLSGAGFENAETVVETSGLSFRKVWIPFRTSSGQIMLKDAIASGSALALKVNGSVDQESGNLDLRGVISPAYGLTGALDNVPLLGTLLSGGEGEGILAMTFTLKGASKDPDFSINPLSLLTPGFLRNVFEGESSSSSEDFRKQIQRQDR